MKRTCLIYLGVTAWAASFGMAFWTSKSAAMWILGGLVHVALLLTFLISKKASRARKTSVSYTTIQNADCAPYLKVETRTIAAAAGRFPSLLKATSLLLLGVSLGWLTFRLFGASADGFMPLLDVVQALSISFLKSPN